jgi:transcriptional regulator with XRE-family HTH domain
MPAPIPHPGTISARFAAERRRLQISRDHLGAAAGVTSVQIGRIERGNSLPGAGVLAALARLGGDVHYVLLGVPSNDERIERLEASFARIEAQLLLMQQLIQQHTTDRSNSHA